MEYCNTAPGPLSVAAEATYTKPDEPLPCGLVTRLLSPELQAASPLDRTMALESARQRAPARRAAAGGCPGADSPRSLSPRRTGLLGFMGIPVSLVALAM